MTYLNKGPTAIYSYIVNCMFLFNGLALVDSRELRTALQLKIEKSIFFSKIYINYGGCKINTVTNIKLVAIY